jgi:site-specific DNA recombinase
MYTTNGHGPKRAILYARVSTDEQARSGYSLAQQIEALRQYAASEGYEVVAEISDPAQSGATLERPGMDRVRDLVADGGVSVVLAQDRDRFSREPAYTYLLRREFEEHDTALRALNDRGDDTPEGQLTDGILDQLAKFERAKTAERSRRGKIRKAREGKVIATNKITYGFRYNEARDGLLLHEEHMSIVRRIVHMVGVEGAPLHRVKKILDAEGIPTPDKGRYWNKKSLKRMLLDDIYFPCSDEEIQGLVAEGLVSPEVAARLDTAGEYGIWWFNRRRYERRRVSEPDGNGGRVYRWRKKIIPRPRSEWVGVPVPSSGIPREELEAAREAMKDNFRPSAAGHRFWELSGGVFFCGACGCRMSTTRQTKGRGYEGHYHYYRCPTQFNVGYDACPQHKGFRAERVESEVWKLVRSLMLEPEHLLDDIERMIEEERKAVRGNPEQEAQAWLERLSDVEQERRGYLRLAAKGHMTEEELEMALADLEETRKTAEGELRAIHGRKEALQQLEWDRDALVEHYANMAPEALESLTPEERHRLYKILRLRVTADAERVLWVEGMFGETFSVENGPGTCVTPLRWNAVSRSSGIRDLSPRTIPRTTAASRGLRP